MTQIAGKTAVVIAGGNGIGRSIAHALAAAGANLVIADIRRDDAERVRDEVIARGRRAVSVPTDVAQLKEVEHLAAVAFDEFGTIEILCNNAGVAVRPPRAIWDTSYADLEYMVDINVWGLLHGYHVFVPRMREQAGAKHIVNTASMGAIITFPSQAVYSMTKSAAESFSRVAGAELKSDGFVTTVVYPGLVNTTAAQRSGELRSPAEREADAQVRPYASYAAGRGEPVTMLGAGRGSLATARGGASSLEAIEPEVVGPLVIDAILHDRPVCMTHPVPVEAIQDRVDTWMSGYHPQKIT
jgi:NAD(P)-dependent dehydrogenase (short-subunit alcohol dehydrogenase family)